jgi:hypothetical protein
MPDVGTFTAYPALKTLPPLVRKQRRLEARLGDDHGPFEKQESAVRKDIDALLVAAGLGQGDFVTCNGYDVTRRGQKGRTSINALMLLETLIIAGLTREEAYGLILEATDTGDPSTWSEVKPSKGSQVRRALTEKHKR